MKIVHVADTVNAKMGGPARSITALASAQAQLGHSVQLVCRDFAHLGPQVVPAGVQMESVPGGRWAKELACFGKGFREAVFRAAAGADVVHSHGLWTAAGVYAREAVRAAGPGVDRPRWVVSTRGMLTPWALRRSAGKKKIAWRLFERKNLEMADLFHATSDSEAAGLEAALAGLGIRRPQDGGRLPVVTVPNGVAFPDWLPGRACLEKKLPALAGKKWAVFLGRIHPVKGVIELVEAWGECGDARQGWVLMLAGPEVDLAYAAKIRSAGVGNVVWTGELEGEEKWAALANAGFVAAPSHTENFGMVIAEALAAGRPVLTTTETPWGAAKQPIRIRMRIREDNNQQSMNLEENGCGVICEVGGLKEALAKILRFSDNQREEMGKQGREWMQKEFSWPAAAKKMVEAYKKKWEHLPVGGLSTS